MIAPQSATSRTPVPRRAVLKGLGAVAVGLPFFEEMLGARAFAAAPALAAAPTAAGGVPVRAFNLFFGLGIPAPLQAEATKNGKLEGVLEPLAPLADKLAVLRNVDQVRCDESGINAHFDGASGAFTAEPPDGDAKSGGPSLDQLIRRAAHPDGRTPDGMIPTLVAGTFFRRSRLSRYVHSYREDGTVAAPMQESPGELFARVFGAAPGTNGAAPADPRSERLTRSVLDAVAAQAKYLSGPRGPLGAASRERLADHLDRVREYERRTLALEGEKAAKTAALPPAPPKSKLRHGDEADPGGEGVDITLTDLTTEWRLVADLYAHAILTDRVRFGSLTYLAAGERIRLTGDYEYGGKKIFSFDDKKQLGKSGAAGCSHEWWHQFREDRPNEALRAHAHLKMREVAYFLNLLAGEEAREANGRTVLENALVTISTESGDGRHNDVKRELSGVFHAITGAGGRFRTGAVLDANAEGLDVYNTLLAGMGVADRLGPKKRDGKAIDALRV
ncbi:DUF1552 domain-containing protein [Alienimonas californiensis]|uniref:DUF1552 domain-containing protein n=1 Tax=Alienimonas californiensis TaxID=2527989 RepID=A0A517PAB8_9PLAN|nr:DUF1552 domain-containing protein [Alienimonas californiensis]QDT16311.1 hypothetical protein CA12_24120 [Alienimonas californiensis]